MVKTQIRCGIIAYSEGKILLIKSKSSGLWGFPKGCKKDDESFENCAIREFYEETGNIVKELKGTLKRIIGRHYYYVMKLDHIVMAPIDTEEIADIKLFSLEEVIKLNNAHSRVRQYTKYSLHKDFYRIGSEIK
jgi:8-oxo-dGTP pyrophosphatase MutT (NUDIX family)